jgi:tRNA(Ile2)-agmatinylcytidine synthase
MSKERFRFFQVGIDDTDSSDGMCTTYLCYTAVKKLLKGGNAELVDYPRLIRLNPNIPWKTRGNAALAVQIKTSLPKDAIFLFFKKIVEKYATSPRANSGLVIFEGLDIPREIQEFSKRALFSVLSLREARGLVNAHNMKSFELRSGQGIVGALASIGNLLERDHTFELIAYRKDLRQKRFFDLEKVVLMSETRFPQTFSSYDRDYDRIMIAPHGPDPVLCGIRGENAYAVRDAFRDLKPVDNLAGYMIFRSNQATGEHLSNKLDLENSSVYSSGTVVGSVSSRPRIEMGGHVFFNLKNRNGEITCACYEPTADFRNAALGLIPGDQVEAAGGIRKPTSTHSRVLNLEALRPLKLEQLIVFSNPKCPRCENAMKSKGRGQIFECYKCGSVCRTAKVLHQERRNISKKLYIPPMKAHRHLTKPLHRYSLPEKKTKLPSRLIEGWIA